MDGITLCAVVHQLNETLINARIEKIYQPERDELLLHFRTGQKLMLSANANHARVQLTENIKKNPAQAPMFCMLLRKHLVGAKVLSFSQPGFERVMHIDLLAQDEMGYETTFTLIIEVMGKHSNIILVKADGKIADAIKHVTPLISSVRSVMPGLAYQLPPAQNKNNPLTESPEHILQVLSGQEGKIEKLIVANWSGFSPVFAKEAALRMQIPEMRWESLDSSTQSQSTQRLLAFFDLLKHGDFSAHLILNPFHDAIACFPFLSKQYDACFQKPFENISQALDAFYASRDLGDRMQQKSAALHKLLSAQAERCYKKLAMQQDIILQADKIEQLRLFGELLTANAYQLSKGLSSVELENYYDEHLAKVAVALDPLLTPMENAQHYYKRYNKMKTAYDMASEQIKTIKHELSYIEGQLDNIGKCSEESELLQIRHELTELGYLKKDRIQRKIIRLPETKPMHFLSSTGIDIYVGKNNTQNDKLTIKFAQSEDIFLHTKDIPGSHVLIRLDGKALDDQTLLEAATLAAYYSKARQSSQVSVDYTPRKFVKKPNGSAPGYVIYSQNRNVLVKPDEALVKSLQKIS